MEIETSELRAQRDSYDAWVARLTPEASEQLRDGASRSVELQAAIS